MRRHVARRALRVATLAGPVLITVVVLAGVPAWAFPGQTLSLLPTLTTVTSSVSPSVYGQAVNVTAQVMGLGLTQPSGDVEFSVDGVAVGSAPVTGSKATLELGALAVGSHQVVASYPGDFIYARSDNKASPYTQTVSRAGTATSITSSANPAAAGAPVVVSVTVAAMAPGGGTPTGSVQLAAGGAAIGSAPLAGGQASLPVATLPVGTTNISATYSGDSNFNGSGGVLAQSVAAGPVVPSPSPPKPSPPASPSAKPKASPSPSPRPSPAASPSPAPSAVPTTVPSASVEAPLFGGVTAGASSEASSPPAGSGSKLPYVALVLIVVVSAGAVGVVALRRR